MEYRIISYDLGQPETSNSYKQLIDRIKAFPDYTKPLESLWIVKSDLSCSEVRDALTPYLDSNDKLFVADFDIMRWASYGLAGDIVNWLKR